LRAINPYGASKWMIETIFADYRSAYGLGAFCLRYFKTPAAPICRAGSASWRDNETHLIPRAMIGAAGPCSDFAVFGDDYDTPTAPRSATISMSSDLAGRICCAELLMQGHSGGRFQSRHRQRIFGAGDFLAAIAAEPAARSPMSSSRGDQAIRPICRRPDRCARNP